MAGPLHPLSDEELNNPDLRFKCWTAVCKALAAMSARYSIEPGEIERVCRRAANGVLDRYEQFDKSDLPPSVPAAVAYHMLALLVARGADEQETIDLITDVYHTGLALAGDATPETLGLIPGEG